RHRHGYGNRHRDGKWRHHPGEGRPGRNRARAKTESGDYAQHPAKSVLCVCLQLGGGADRGGCALSVLRFVAEPDSGGGRDESEFGFCDYEFAALAKGEVIATSGSGVSLMDREKKH